ncbi:hypothetical protein SDC9_56744 [bioreactor metagenome]|uniref:Uncharacterized protein n=1 Tax=bioreactor metagenome TaxID=1076179 RepID=A0A644X2N0_9ZZZZ
MEELKTIFNKYSECIDTVSKEFMEELKKGCKTYREVYSKLNRIEKEISWNYGNEKYIGLVFITYVKGLLDREMSDSPLTNRSWK